jgi:hypothetical protein
VRRLPALLPAASLLVLVAAGDVLSACEHRSPVEPSPPCTVAVSPASREFADTGGTGTVTVSAAAGCTWTASTSQAWISLPATRTGSGDGSVTYVVAGQTAAEARSGVVSVEGQPHTVTQRGHVAPPECRVELSPTAAHYGKDAADGQFAVAVAAGCEWTASSDAAWLIVSGGARGAGAGTVSYSVTRNGAVDGRAAAITVADRTFAVTQAGDTGICDYAVAPVEIQTCMPGTTLVATVTTQAACPWTATPDAAWVELRSGATGTGSGTIAMRLTDNYDAPRSARILVRWPTPTLGQNIRITQAGCRYAVSRSAIAIDAAGGSGTFDVIQQSDPTTCGGATQDGCVWSAVASVPWLTITSHVPARGDDRVAFSVAPNPTSTPRTGTIAVRDQTVTVTQAGTP